ncbi:hypothetical protein [Pendulispora albinea]|uniref:Uncharacterized protein n=1 Tax=Pendulispora albinea TaxID=2741071 RepID=A0ABZ2M090_9BACT
MSAGWSSEPRRANFGRDGRLKRRIAGTDRMISICIRAMIPPPVQTLIEIFRTELADLRFADMDAKGLSDVATDVQSATDALTTAQAAVDAARAQLQERQEALLHYAQRALAYARIYAETNDDLRTRLEGIALPRPARRPNPKADETPASSPEASADAPVRRRGRPRKSETGTAGDADIEATPHAAE